MPSKAIRGKTECPRRVSASLTAGFDSHRLHQEAPVNDLSSPYLSKVALRPFHRHEKLFEQHLAGRGCDDLVDEGEPS
jgi:hypothetical protein